MSNDKNLDQILNDLQTGSLSVDEAKKRLTSFVDIGFAKLDVNREQRNAFPEVIYGEGKTADQIIQIIGRLMNHLNRVFATRISEQKAVEILQHYPQMSYNSVARTLFWKHEEEPTILYDGYVSIVCAGTSDLPVAEEAALTCEAFGCKVERIYDVGVAGIHRLFSHLGTIENGSATVAVAGMEGALGSVIGGLISNPIFAVPTSVGYGANFQGLSALLSMLNSCAPGLSVVNIDNGFGAGYNAALVTKMTSRKPER
jgi:NCAIR mutase (PurE)-related protein